MAWLYKSVWSSMWGQPQASVDEAQTAVDLSPIDPMKYYFDMILACGHSMNSNYPQAIALAQRSLKANSHHQPTIRVLLHAQGQSGLWVDAKNTLARLQQTNPGLTISSYLAVGADSASRQQVATVMRRLGVPEN